MLILIVIFLIIVSIHNLSYAKYVWDQNNKTGAVSVIILAVITFVFPLILAYLRL